MNFKDYFNESKYNPNFTKPLEGLGRLINPISKGGALGKALYGRFGLKRLENLLKTGQGGEYGSATESIQKWREYKIYPMDENQNFNIKALKILGLKSFPIETKEQKSSNAFKNWVIKRNRPIGSAAHIANLVMDAYAKSLQKQIPKDRALQNALEDTLRSETLRNFIKSTGMIAAV